MGLKLTQWGLQDRRGAWVRGGWLTHRPDRPALESGARKPPSGQGLHFFSGDLAWGRSEPGQLSEEEAVTGPGPSLGSSLPLFHSSIDVLTW